MTATARPASRLATERVNRRVMIGRTPDGARVWVELRLELRRRPDGSPWETVDHDHVTSALSLSLVGESIEFRGRTVSSAGQITDTVLSVADGGTPAKGWTRGRVRDLCAIWRRWHLNDMSAGCAHRAPVMVAGADGELRPSTTATPPCPVTGYRYGHAWLVDPLPRSVIVTLCMLFPNLSVADVPGAAELPA